jgi:hypothetical protein
LVVSIGFAIIPVYFLFFFKGWYLLMLCKINIRRDHREN